MYIAVLSRIFIIFISQITKSFGLTIDVHAVSNL